MGKHGQDGPAVPGSPGADLVLVQAAQALAGVLGKDPSFRPERLDFS